MSNDSNRIYGGHIGQNANQLNHRPTSYPVDGCGVGTEQSREAQRAVGSAANPVGVLVPAHIVVQLRDLRNGWTQETAFTQFERLRLLLNQLPEPPKPDVVEECAKLAYENNSSRYRWDGLTAEWKGALRSDMRAAIRYYRALGCPEIPE
jgi:hypothetical protein